MPKQYKLKGTSLDDIRVKAEQQYGPGARIVSAEKVTNPGIAGLFAANRYEATIEVPSQLAGNSCRSEGPERQQLRVSWEAHALQGPAIAALLEQADAVEMDMHRPEAVVSTASPDFAGILEQLGNEFRAPASGAPTQGALTALPHAVVGHAVPAAPPAAVPVPLAGSGNLVILLGLGDDALGTALELSIAGGGFDVRTAGALTAFGHLHVTGRQGATAARAQAVVTDQTVLVAYGLGRQGEAVTRAADIATLAADQLWLVVDAGRKAEDTASWVRALSAALAAERVRVDALAVFGASETGSPETVNGLGLPIGWVDGKPARVAVLGKVD
ncbi:hypothetical protein KNN17_07315 [Arthrobacter bambusae]|uniref:hypothetical protein n=1 Tax=Arthrobacter TaxID=1663 RepID=UPI001F50AA2F|nr:MULTISPECIES: hypothetical protein [Arthrobacter]MCI0141386.1 hypothetical protein [Arthrobacter bambusae]UYY82237.1 hypothetical protein OIT41_04025 [Arthrobacter sp. YA7-1]